MRIVPVARRGGKLLSPLFTPYEMLGKLTKVYLQLCGWMCGACSESAELTKPLVDADADEDYDTGVASGAVVRSDEFKDAFELWLPGLESVDYCVRRLINAVRWMVPTSQVEPPFG